MTSPTYYKLLPPKMPSIFDNFSEEFALTKADKGCRSIRVYPVEQVDSESDIQQVSQQTLELNEDTPDCDEIGCCMPFFKLNFTKAGRKWLAKNRSKKSASDSNSRSDGADTSGYRGEYSNAYRAYLKNLRATMLDRDIQFFSNAENVILDPKQSSEDIITDPKEGSIQFRLDEHKRKLGIQDANTWCERSFIHNVPLRQKDIDEAFNDNRQRAAENLHFKRIKLILNNKHHFESDNSVEADFNEEYTVERLIGGGSFGVAVECSRRQTNSRAQKGRVACKIIRRERIRDFRVDFDTFAGEFRLNEIELLHACRSEFVVQAYDEYWYRNYVILSMELFGNVWYESEGGCSRDLYAYLICQEGAEQLI